MDGIDLSPTSLSRSPFEDRLMRITMIHNNQN